MSETSLTVQNNRLAIMPVMDISAAKMRRQAVIDFTKVVMVSDVDYGKVPGTNKDTLLKPGAEKLTSLFGLSPRFDITEKVTDWTGRDHDGEPFFYFQYTCSLYYGDILAGQGVGSCNSWEKKYRYRKAELACPECGAAAIKKSKYPPRNAPNELPGWYCYDKAGGCGANFPHNSPLIVDQPRGDVPNPNPADLVNTVDKMAQKRALVAATLIAVNASEFFTQDVEDMDFGVVEGEYMEVHQQPVKQQTPKQRPQAEPPATGSGNGTNHAPKPFIVDNWYNYIIEQSNAYYRDKHHIQGTLKKFNYTIPDNREQAQSLIDPLLQYANYRRDGHDGDIALDMVVNGQPPLFDEA